MKFSRNSEAFVSEVFFRNSTFAVWYDVKPFRDRVLWWEILYSNDQLIILRHISSSLSSNSEASASELVSTLLVLLEDHGQKCLYRYCLINLQYAQSIIFWLYGSICCARTLYLRVFVFLQCSVIIRKN